MIGKLQGGRGAVGRKNEVIMGKLDGTGSVSSRYRGAHSVIKYCGIADDLNLQLEIGAVSGHTKNAGIKIKHVNFIDGGKEALGKNVALRIMPGTESGRIHAAGSPFLSIADIAGHGPATDRANGIVRSGFKIAITQGKSARRRRWG
jgi:hypothetical protein